MLVFFLDVIPPFLNNELATRSFVYSDIRRA